MQITLRRVAMITALAAFIPLTAPAVHAAPVFQAGQTAQDTAPVTGELMRVNPDAKTLMIKTANGVEVQFRYTDQTSVTGAEKSVAGLATMSGAQLTVSYKIEGTSNVATRIEVREKS
jgi:hypothetical protein